MPEVVIVTTDGVGSLAGYSRQLARVADAPAIETHGCSGSFGRPLLGKNAARCALKDAQVVGRLRRVDASLLRLSHHLARYGPSLGSPYVVTVHDLMRHRDWCARGDGEPLIHEPNARDRVHLRLDAAGLRRARALVAVSGHTKRELVELLGVPAGRVHVVPEGVDSGAFHRVDARPLADPYVLYVGLGAAAARTSARSSAPSCACAGAPGWT